MGIQRQSPTLQGAHGRYREPIATARLKCLVNIFVANSDMIAGSDQDAASVAVCTETAQGLQNEGENGRDDQPGTYTRMDTRGRD